MKNILKKILASVLLCTSLAGCTQKKSQIAYTVYPVGFLIDRITGDSEIGVSVQENGMVQRAQLKSDYRQILENSGIFLYIGDLEPYRSVYSKEINAECPTQMDLSVLNAVYDFERYTPIYTDGEVTYLESAYYKDPCMETIDVDDKDLYLWMDPIAMLSMAKDINKWLISAYPENEKIYGANLEKLETDLINLDAQYQALATKNQVEKKEIRFVSMTASFGNWQKTYGFEVYPVVLSKYGVLPDEQQLQVIEQRIKNDNVHYIVYEQNMPSDMVELFNRVQEDCGLTRVEFSNLSSLSDAEDEAGKDYLSIMYENLSVLETMAESRPGTTQESTDTTAEESAETETN